MTDHHETTRAVHKRLFQTLDGWQIYMVRGFIHIEIKVQNLRQDKL
jgi:hypothetical protein